MTRYDRKTIEELIDGTLDWVQLKEMISSFKDPERFDLYLDVLQDRVSWPERILLPYGLHLYIVAKPDGRRIVKCDCGHEFGDYRENWKLQALIYLRETEEAISELYPRFMGPDPEWQVLREYYCPQCLAQLEVEAVPAWYPVIFDFEPDLEGFYEEWLGRPLPAEPSRR